MDTDRNRPWDGIISEEEQRAYRAAGFGRPRDGLRPALLIIDVQYRTVGTKPMPFWEAIKEFPTSCGEVGWDAVRISSGCSRSFARAAGRCCTPRGAEGATDGGRLAAKVPAIMTIAEQGLRVCRRGRAAAGRHADARRSTRARSSPRRWPAI